MPLPSTDTTPPERDSSPLPYVFQYGSSDPFSPSILWLHGATGSHHQFTPLLPLFHPQNKYHHILLDFPGHGIDVVNSFSYIKALDWISLAIQRYAHGGKCNIVGFSLGGNVVLSLIRNRPKFVEEHIDGIFVTGATLGSSRIMTILFDLSIPVTRLYLELFRFEWFTNWFHEVIGIRWSPELIQDMKNWNSFAQFTRITQNTRQASDVPDNIVEKVDVQLYLCTGSKEPLAKKIMEVDRVMRMKVKVCKSFVALGMVHMWDAQVPQKFVETVEGIFEGQGEVPDGIVPMEKYYDVITGKKKKEYP